jgi:hypothetical protein
VGISGPGASDINVWTQISFYSERFQHETTKATNMRDFKRSQHQQMREKVALLNDTAIELQERGLKKEGEFHFSEACRVLNELAAEYPEETSESLMPLSDQIPRLLSSIGTLSHPRLAQPIFVRDLALGSTCVPTMAVVLMYNTGLFYFRLGELKMAENVLNLAYSSVGTYNKIIGGHDQFLVQVTIVLLDLLGRVKICRAFHACCEQHETASIADGLHYHIQAVELGQEHLGAQHYMVGVCLASFADDLARIGYLSEAMQGFTEACNVLTKARSLSEYLEGELDNHYMHPAAAAA